MKGAFTMVSFLFRSGCIWLLVVSFLGCSVARLAAEELKLYDDTLWMGQVIITEDRWLHEKPEPKPNPQRYSSHTHDGHAEVTITVCGKLGELKVTDVQGYLSWTDHKQVKIEYKSKRCEKPAAKEHGDAYCGHHLDECYWRARPGDSELETRSMTWTLHTSPNCGQWGERGVKDPVVRVSVRGDKYQISASARLITNLTSSWLEEKKEVCSGEITRSTQEMKTVDCGQETSISMDFSQEGGSTITFTTTPGEYTLCGSSDKEEFRGDVLSGSKSLKVGGADDAAPYTTTTISTTTAWYLSTSPSRAYDECVKSAFKLLERCTEGAYHRYDSTMDRKKVEEHGVSCAEGYVDRCFDEAGSIADKKERYSKKVRCIDEHCETDVFPDDVEPTSGPTPLRDHLIKCFDQYRDRKSKCTKDYGCP